MLSLCHMKFSRDDIEHLAKLAQISLSEEEKKLYGEQLSSIVSYAERLQLLDVSSVPADWKIGQATQAIRRDEVLASSDPADLLASSVWYESATRQLHVPPVFGERDAPKKEEEETWS